MILSISKLTISQSDENLALDNRKDLEAVRFQEKASEAGVKLAKGAYYPSVTLIGGYASLDYKM